MKEAKFTGGDWFVSTTKIMESGIVSHKINDGIMTLSEGIANAHLIAAARDIYRAVMKAVALFERLGMQHTEEYRELAKASKKARGE